MFVVAATRWSRPFEQDLVELAAQLLMSAYDLRLRLSGPLPVVLGTGFLLDPSRKLLDFLRSRGHGAVVCETSDVVASEILFSPREFVFEPTALHVSTAASEQSLPYTDITALLPASHKSAEERSSTNTSENDLAAHLIVLAHQQGQ